MDDYFLTRYSGSPALAFGFHGCTEETARLILCRQEEIKDSTNEYDWLGHGKYFWESNPLRALEWALRNKCKKSRDAPAVVGACIDLAHCLNLLDSNNLKKLRVEYEILRLDAQNAGFRLPENINAGPGNDRLIRKLDCLIINNVCKKYNELHPGQHYTTVRGVFWEGDELYPSSGFKMKNHIQICVRDERAILGYFWPRHFDIKKLSKQFR